MRRFLFALALALAVPAIAGAQQNPGPPNPAMRGHMHADKQQMMQIVKLHQQFRAQVLGALTPANKQLYASVVGNLAIAERPDPHAAVEQLDAALSPSEKSAILNANEQLRTAMKPIMQQLMAEHPWPKPSGSPWPRHGQGPHKPRTPDAGEVLLEMAGGHAGMMMHRMGDMHGRPGMQHP